MDSSLMCGPQLPADILHNRGVLMELKKQITRRRTFLIAGPSGCGKSALCSVALSDASVLDVGAYYMHHQTGENAQKDPKQVILAFATRKTIEQFMTPKPKVVYVDDLHVLTTRDRLLTKALASLMHDPGVTCAFVITMLPEHAIKLSAALDVPFTSVLTMTYAPPKTLFRAANVILDADLVSEQDTADLLFLCKRSGGNWHDFITSVDRRFQKRGGAVSSSNCRDDKSYKRDLVACMRPIELVEYVLSDCRDSRSAESLVDCDCAELMTLTYENWLSYARRGRARDSDDTFAIKLKKTSERCEEGRVKVLNALCEVGDIYLITAAMDAHAMSTTDWALKDMSTLCRYGGLIANLNVVRRTPFCSCRAKPVLSKHLTKVSVAKKLPESEYHAAWLAQCDSAATSDQLSSFTRPYVSAMQSRIF